MNVVKCASFHNTRHTYSTCSGPAGTGKTESVKALGNQMGRFVLVFNCDETFDFQVKALSKVHSVVVPISAKRISCMRMQSQSRFYLL